MAENASADPTDASSGSQWYIGLCLDVVATLAGTGGKQLLRHAAVSKNMWFYPLGLVCTAVIDPAFDISAYSFAAQSIIAPCAGMVVVWNVLLAPWTLGETVPTTVMSVSGRMNESASTRVNADSLNGM